MRIKMRNLFHWYDRPVRFEVAVQRDCRRMRYGDCRGHLVELVLKILAGQSIEVRPLEIGMKSSNHRAIGFIYRDQGKRRTQRRMHMNEIVSATSQRLTHLFPKRKPDCQSGLRTVEIHGLARSEANDVRLLLCTLEPRRDDVNVMAKLACFAREKMDVLADSAEVR